MALFVRASRVSVVADMAEDRVRRRREKQADTGMSLAEEASVMSKDLRAFVRAACQHVLPIPLVETWHVDSISDHLQAAYEREIPRLVITIQPGAMKSTLVSVIAPAWRWTHKPQERIVSASHTDRLATRDSRLARALMESEWYQERWGRLWGFNRDENSKIRYSNTEHGFRVVTHVNGGTGERGHVLVLDDAHNTQDAMSTTELSLDEARNWFGNTWSSRVDSIGDDPGVKIVIGQRVHERDVIGFILDADTEGDRWTHLCLPAHYDRKHPFVYPDNVELPTGRVIQGDPRTEDDELLAPLVMDEERFLDTTHEMSSMTIASQYQQLPAPREGSVLKRQWWRYYHPNLLEDPESLPPFRMIVHSWDTAFKAKTSSDYVAGTTWGIAPPNLYLLRLRHERMGMGATMDAMKEARLWGMEHWPRAAHYLLIEKAANGAEIIDELKREIPGITPVIASVDKMLRAEAAAPDLESGNIFLPGWADADLSGPDPATPSMSQLLIDECSVFDKGANDDLVDSFTQAVNWIRLRGKSKARTSVPKGRIPVLGQVAAATGRRPF